MKLTLHGSGLSPFARKVMVAFAEKGVAYESQDAVPFPKTPELLSRSPLGKIPFLEVDGTFLPDSSVICNWLERTHPTPPLLPADAVSAARALWFEEYADTKVTEVTSTPFFQRFIQPNFFQQQPNEEQIAKAVNEHLPPILDYLTEQLGDAEYLVDGQFSLADIATCSPFVNLRVGGEDVDAGRWPKFSAYLERILSRPSFKSAMEGLPSLG